MLGSITAFRASLVLTQKFLNRVYDFGGGGSITLKKSHSKMKNNKFLNNYELHFVEGELDASNFVLNFGYKAFTSNKKVL